MDQNVPLASSFYCCDRLKWHSSMGYVNENLKEYETAETVFYLYDFFYYYIFFMEPNFMKSIWNVFIIHICTKYCHHHLRLSASLMLYLRLNCYFNLLKKMDMHNIIPGYL